MSKRRITIGGGQVVIGLEEVFEGIRQALEADGYRLEVAPVQGGVLRMTIIPTAGACEECLMPKDILRMMIEQALTPDLAIRTVELCYPNAGE